MRNKLGQLSRLLVTVIIVACLEGSIAQAAKFKAVKASAAEAKSPANLVIDDNMSTRWAVNGKGNWLQFELPKKIEVYSISIAWFKGNSRQNYFDLEISSDGKEWQKILTEEESSGSSDKLEIYPFTPVTAKYIKLIVNGNSSNEWASIYEIKLNQGKKTVVKSVTEVKAEVNASSLISTQEKLMSFEIWPGGRRLSNTVYLIGKEYNHLYFNLSASKRHLGKHKLKLPKILKKAVTLTLDYPQNVQYKGTAGQANKILETTKTTVIHDGKHYNRYIITLPQTGSSGLDNRLLKNNYYYNIFSYIIPPAKLNGKIYWQLKYGNRLLAEDVSKFITVGTIDAKAKLPKRFTSGSSGGANLWSFPNMNYKSLANLYHRLGITSTDVIYGVNDKKFSPQKKAFCNAFRHAGISINALRGGSFMEYRRTSPEKYGEKGLIWGANKEANYYNQPKERAAFALIAPYVDGYTFDYEPMFGPDRIPGYDDKPTIAAFARKYGIKGKLTKKLLTGKYHDKYYRYRQELLIEPIKALRKLVDSVKMMPIYLEQGSGLGAHLDYKLYDKYVDYHCPMFYMPSLIDYYTKVTAMAKYIDPKKLVPDTTYGYTGAGVMRQTPDAVMLDIVSTAVNGAAGHRVWPGVAYVDEGLLWGAWQGLKMVAVAENFYFDGQESKAIKVKPLTYKSKVIKIGSKTLDISSPNWGSSFRYRVHKLNNDYLITLLNFNNSQDAYVELSSPIFKHRLLINPLTGEYLKVNGNDAVMVKVKKTTPVVWLVTSLDSTVARKVKLDQDQISSAYQRSKVDFNRHNKNVGISLGRKGNIAINYNAIEVDGQELICLEVSTPSQKIAFNENGGRIFSWEIDGKNIVASKKLSQGGFAMDLLWLPASARWSGDEIQTMKLIACNNDGKVATIVYSGEFKRAMPGLKIKKTFTINAQNKTIAVSVKLLNTQALPVTLSYWSHNTMTVIASGICYLKNGEIICKDTGTGTTIFPNRQLPKAEQKYVFARNRIVDDSDNLYAEVFANSNDVLLLHLPENFMNIYRYKKGTEWMSRPITIQPTSSITLNFSYTITDKNELMKLGHKAAAVQHDKSEVKAALVGVKPVVTQTPAENNNPPATDKLTVTSNKLVSNTDNLISDYADKDSDGFPDAYMMNKGQGKENISYVAGAATPTLKIKGNPTEPFIFKLKDRLQLEQNRKYLYVLEIKIDDMKFAGHWYKTFSGMWIYLMGKNGAHTWMTVAGNGSTKDWITLMLPFDTIGEKHENLANCRTWIRVNQNNAGTFYVRNPKLIKLDDKDDMKQQFIKADGTIIVNSRFKPTN